MATRNRSQLAVDIIFNNKNARQFANQFGQQLNDVTRAWGDNVARQTSEGIQAGTKMALASGKTGSAISKVISSNFLDVYSKFRSELNAGNLAAAEKLEQVLGKQLRHFEREAEAIADGFEAVQKRQSKTFTDSAESFKDALGSLRSGNIGGLGQGLGTRLLQGGQARQQRGMNLGELARQQQDASGGPGTHDYIQGTKAAEQAASMAKMGSSIASLGKGLMAFGAVAGVLLLMVKIFADLEQKAIDMNKTLIAGAGALDFGLGEAELGVGELSERLKELRASTADLNQNFRDFGASADDQQRILAALNQEGISYGKMTEGTTNAAQRMEKYQDILRSTLTYVRVLGVGFEELAKQQGEIMLETKMGPKGIAEQFSIIADEALRAGFTTKRFYAAVMEATSGMAFYGVRIGETAKLLSNFQSLLGETVGADLFKSMTGKYKSMGIQDRTKEMLLKGKPFVQKALGKSSERSEAALEHEFAGRLGTHSIAGMLNMSKEDIGPLLERIEDSKGKKLSQEEKTRISNARDVRSASKTGGEAEMALAMSKAGIGFDVEMGLNAGTIFEGQNVGELMAKAQGVGGIANVAGIEETTSMNMDQLQALEEFWKRGDAKLRNLTRISGEITAAGGTRENLSKGDLRTLEEAEKQSGIMIDDKTGVIAKDGIEIKNATDLATIISETSATELAEHYTRDQKIATEISSTLYGLNDILEQSIAKILNDIYGVVAEIGQFMFKDSPEKLQRLAAIEGAKKEREDVQNEINVASRKMRDVDFKLRGAEGSEEASLLLEKKELEEKLLNAQDRLGRARATETAVGKTASEGGLYSAIVDQLIEGGLIDPAFSSKHLEAVTEHLVGTGKAGDSVSWSAGTYNDSVEDISRTTRERLDRLPTEQQTDFVTMHGGTEKVDAAIKAGEEAARQAEDLQSWTDMDFQTTKYEKKHAAFAAAFTRELVKGLDGSSLSGNVAPNVTITNNINGGDLKAVYETVMKGINIYWNAMKGQN